MDVLTALRASQQPLTDDQLADLLHRDMRAVGRECRSLAFRGLVIREERAGAVLNKVYSEV